MIGRCTSDPHDRSSRCSPRPHGALCAEETHVSGSRARHVLRDRRVLLTENTSVTVKVTVLNTEFTQDCIDFILSSPRGSPLPVSYGSCQFRLYISYEISPTPCGSIPVPRRSFLTISPRDSLPSPEVSCPLSGLFKTVGNILHKTER